jgi:hypothetical protein
MAECAALSAFTRSLQTHTLLSADSSSAALPSLRALDSGGALAALARTALRAPNASGAVFFVDGLLGAPARHAAVHSTLFAAAAGAADGEPAPTQAGLVAFLRAHGVPPSSCMMGRWWVEALYRLGVADAAAADLALDVLTSAAYPSWLDMLAQGATVTTEAWRAADKVSTYQRNPGLTKPSCCLPAASREERAGIANPT